jgi:hypothetical protein
MRILLPPRNKVGPLKKFQNAVFDSLHICHDCVEEILTSKVT